jgi:16S rRNA U516 pseudouridylate synthase RsuA-like enzyme
MVIKNEADGRIKEQSTREMRVKGMKEKKRRIKYIYIVYHKYVEYHSSNGSHNSPMMGDPIQSPTLD